MGCSWDRIGSIIVLAIAFFGCLSAISIAEEGTVIGIDIGTSNSRVGVFKDGKINLSKPVASWEAFTGEAANNPDETFFDFKRSIGRGRNFKIKDEEISPEEITRAIFSVLKKEAEALLGKNVKDAVLAVPAYFDSAQREAIKEAGTKAGLTVVRIIEEPIAAAIAYGLDKIGGEKNILVFDHGGGTLDVTILKTANDGTLKVLANNTSDHLGGKAFDINTMEELIKSKNICKSNTARAKLRRKCEIAKIGLSSNYKQDVPVVIPDPPECDIYELLNGQKFSDFNKNLFDKIIQFVDTTVKDIINKEQIHEIVLVGGNSRIPEVQKRLKEYFNGKEPIKGEKDAVVHGAAKRAEEESQVSHHINDPADIVHARQYLIDLTGVPPSRRGTPEIEVKFKVDAHGILNVKAEDTGSSKPMKITITNNKGWWSQEEINGIAALDSLGTYIKNHKLDKIFKSALDWLNENQNAKKEDYKENLKDVEAVCKPILNAVYQRTAREMTHDEL